MHKLRVVNEEPKATENGALILIEGGLRMFLDNFELIGVRGYKIKCENGANVLTVKIAIAPEIN